MSAWSEIISRPQKSSVEDAQKLSFVRYTEPRTADHRPLRSVITLENRGLILSAGTTGFRTWEAALHLGTYLSTPEGRRLVEGMNVIELGSGTGFLSLYCLKCLGANTVMATDRDPALLSNIQDCVPRNNLDPSRIGTGIWEWGNDFDADQCFPGPSQNFDVALGADLVCILTTEVFSR